MSTAFLPRQRDLDLPRWTIKGLRHTWATLALGADIHPKIVQERLGHSTVGVAKRFLVVHDVTMLDTWEWAESRLAELGAIEHGWFDGEHGEPVDEAAFDAAGALLEGLADAEASPPHLFPTPEGGIQAQWRDDAVTVSVEFEPGGRTSLHALNVESGEDQYVELESADIDRAVRFVIDTTRAAS